jgi:NAD kinase
VQPVESEKKLTHQQTAEFHSLNEVTIMRSEEGMAQIEIYINDVLLTVV